MKIYYKNLLGFTLVEMTEVLVIIGLLLAGLLVPLREGIKQERRVNTEEELKTIEDLLYGFAITNGRLPCPDCRNNAAGCAGATANDGQEDLIPVPGAIAGTQQCALDPLIATVVPNAPNQGNVIEGNLPWATLGVDQFDEWQSWYTYAVMDFVADFTGAGTAGIAPVPATCNVFGENITTIDICAVGIITIQNISAALCPPPVAPIVQSTLSTNAMAVVLSHGENIVRSPAGAGLINAPNICNEIENTNQDNIFISSSYINPGPPGAAAGAGGTSLYGIDDQIIWISPHLLKSKLVQAGRLP